MLSDVVIEKLNNAARDHVMYGTSIYIVAQNGLKNSAKYYTLRTIADETCVQYNYSYLVAMSKDEVFETDNESTDYIRKKIHDLKIARHKYQSVLNSMISDYNLDEYDVRYLMENSLSTIDCLVDD